MSGNDDYTRGHLFDFSNRQICYKLNDIDLSSQTYASIPHQINFTRKMEEDDCATMFFVSEKQQNTTNEYRYFLDSNFVGVNRLFVLSYLNRDNDVKRFKTPKYYLPKQIITSLSMGKTFTTKQLNRT